MYAGILVFRYFECIRQFFRPLVNNLMGLKFFLLKENCFTEFCCFLSNLNMNQPQVYIYPLPFETPFHLSPHPTPLGWYRVPVWVSWAIQQILIGFLFYITYVFYITYGNVSFHVTLSIHLTLSSPLPMFKSLFSMSVSPLLPCK